MTTKDLLMENMLKDVPKAFKYVGGVPFKRHSPESIDLFKMRLYSPSGALYLL